MKPILLVEDNLRDADLARAALRKTGAGNELVVVADGLEAIEYIFRRGRHVERPPGAPAVMLLDIKMPRVDGFDVLRVLRQEIAATWIPIVMLTASNSEFDIRKSYELGANGYVVKPYAFDKFVGTLQLLSGYWVETNRTPT